MDNIVKNIKSISTLVVKGESGQGSLIAVLVMLVVGALIISPILGLMIGGLRSGQALESRGQEYYAADAGAEDALYRIEEDDLPADMKGVWTAEDYGTSYNYSGWLVNGKEMDVTIQPIWILEELEDPSASVNGKTPPDLFADSHPDGPLNLSIAGDVIASDRYKISLIYGWEIRRIL